MPYQRWTLTTSAQLGGAADYITLVNALQKSGAERQRNAREAFLQFCEREQLPEPGGRSLNHPSAEWRVETGDERSCLIEYGRAADIVVLGRSRDDKTVAMDLIEAALMATGRPVLIAPAEARSRLTGTVAIAWKNSPELGRSVAAALPLIEAADHVVIFSVEEGTEIGEQSCDHLRNALTWHNPNIGARRLQRDDRAAVEILLAAAEEVEADLLVMGGYGHSHVRETIFGGFTRHVLNSAQLPVLMAH